MRKIFFILIFYISFYKVSNASAPSNVSQENKTSFGLINFLTRGHIIGLRLGCNTSGFTHLGMMNQDLLSTIQYGVVFMYRIFDNIGVKFEILHTKFGNANVPMSIPIAISPDTHASGKDTEDDNDSGIDLEPIIDSVSKKFIKKIMTRKEQSICMDYISFPLSLCIIFKSHPKSLFKNYLLIGPQFNILLRAQKTMYGTPSILRKKTKDQWEWEWTDTESCSNCIIKEDLKPEIKKFDVGVNIGYMLETNIGLMFGLKYYCGLLKVYNRDINSFSRKRRHFSIEVYLGYNFLSIFS